MMIIHAIIDYIEKNSDKVGSQDSILLMFVIIHFMLHPNA